MINSDVKTIKDALFKRAVGGVSVETVEEYQGEESEVKLVKKKVTKKDLPPDVSASKLYLELEVESDVCSLSDEELESEKQRLLSILKEKEIKSGS